VSSKEAELINDKVTWTTPFSVVMTTI